jgi:hypothetical protein
VAGAADEAVRRPDRQLVAPVLFEAAHIVESAPVHAGHRGSPDAVFNVGAADAREDGRVRAARVLPEDGVRDVYEVVRVQRDVHVVESALQAAHHRRQARHVVLRAGHVERAARGVAEVNLRVND